MIQLIPERLAVWANWVIERERCRWCYESKQPKPWSEDPILQTTRFTNVRRMDDKVSRWLIDWWPRWVGSDMSYTRAQLAQLAAAVALGRLVNWPDSLGACYPSRFTYWQPERVRKVLRAQRERGEKVFTGAYIINGGKGGNKIDTIIAQVDAVRTCAAFDGFINFNSFEVMCDNLQDVGGIGSFMAGQMAADLRWFVGDQWEDRKKWAPMGPGSTRGAAWLVGRDAANPFKRSEENKFLEVIEALFDAGAEFPVLSKIFADRQLEAMDLQNTLCELSKYVRVSLGGRAKNHYDGIA